MERKYMIRVLDDDNNVQASFAVDFAPEIGDHVKLVNGKFLKIIHRIIYVQYPEVIAVKGTYVESKKSEE
jgi:hypothetical protein